MASYNADTYTSSQMSRASQWAMEARARIYGNICAAIDFSTVGTILDVGVTADQSRKESNFFELLFPDKHKITALSDQDASWMEQAWPGITFVPGDGRNMPFPDSSFDLVFSSAVVEHVGSVENQKAFVKECVRVAKKFVFLTTPNRWHPVEFHTVLPLLHWLPKNMHRFLLRGMGKHELAEEQNLNLLDRRGLVKLCKELHITGYTVDHIRFFGFVSNLLLIVRKER